jgi:hypothetical protein
MKLQLPENYRAISSSGEIAILGESAINVASALLVKCAIARRASPLTLVDSTLPSATINRQSNCVARVFKQSSAPCGSGRPAGADTITGGRIHLFERSVRYAWFRMAMIGGSSVADGENLASRLFSAISWPRRQLSLKQSIAIGIMTLSSAGQYRLQCRKA